jgi:hypothetical protein
MSLWVLRISSSPQFYEPDPSSSDCDSDGANSVHFTGEALCLVPVQLGDTGM